MVSEDLYTGLGWGVGEGRSKEGRVEWETKDGYAPQRDAIVIGPDGQRQALHTVGGDDVLEDVDVQLPIGRGRFAGAIGGLDEIHRDRIGGEGVGETLGRSFVLRNLQDSHRIDSARSGEGRQG